MDIKTFDELFAEAQARQPQRKPRSEPEHDLQVDCVQWFSLQYPSLRGRLFAVPNGGHRSKTEAARLKAEGVNRVEKGVFGADMKVELLNDGPFTIVLDSDEIFPNG